MVESRGANSARGLAVVIILLSLGTLTVAMARGGDIEMILLGLFLAATSMEMFRRAKPDKEDE
jgi:hypothetical protein